MRHSPHQCRDRGRGSDTNELASKEIGSKDGRPLHNSGCGESPGCCDPTCTPLTRVDCRHLTDLAPAPAVAGLERLAAGSGHRAPCRLTTRGARS
jgi:hypothetical protein